ncbi:MAG TPA: asparagine synthetase B [Candidatus Rifleibacterium sp.]|nr:asparagine synthetase B [Candidatus Rifleibacterium sp.]HPT48083.1 asparagine synthetase B [Candidatus Rifleibacterium sp.]
MNKLKILLAMLLLVFCAATADAQRILIPMDDAQADHLRSYGVTYWVLDKTGTDVEWLLNYRGGAFLTEDLPEIRERARSVGVTVELVTTAQVNQIYALIEEENMEKVLLEKAPKVAVYSPDYAEPWDDAVTLVLNYAQIPFEGFYDQQVLNGEISKYDWVHLHHEDFTGQFGKFYGSFRFVDWYRKQVTRAQLEAQKAGFKKVSEMKLAVARGIKKFVLDGGFLFAMCSAADTLDIALAANGTDIIAREIDGDDADPLAQSKLDFEQCLAFRDFKIMIDPMIYEFSDIDVSNNYSGDAGTMRLFEFAAKVDPIPTMLTQNHRNVIEGFFGQTTSFRKSLLKPSITVMGDNNDGVSVKYLRGDLGKGFFSFYGGHDPADISHIVGEGPTRLELHKNNPGYRLILNNILFPAAKKKERKT